MIPGKVYTTGSSRSFRDYEQTIEDYGQHYLRLRNRSGFLRRHSVRSATSHYYRQLHAQIFRRYSIHIFLYIYTANVQSCAAEIANVNLWADVNILKLNGTVSAVIVFVPPRSKRALMTVPPPAVADFERVESIKALGVTISRRFSVAEHMDNLLAA
jgi:hypothetical protein